MGALLNCCGVEQHKRHYGLVMVVVWVTLVNSLFSTRMTFSRELDFEAFLSSKSPEESVLWDTIAKRSSTQTNLSSSREQPQQQSELLRGGSSSSSSFPFSSSLSSRNVTNNEQSEEDKRQHLQQHPHPYAGAKDAHGHWGYIHNAKCLQLQQHSPHVALTISPRERAQICAPPGQGPEGNLEAYQFLTEHLQLRNASTIQNHNTNTNIQLFCAVYTHAGSRDLTVAAVETWARRCDGFLAASTLTNATYGMVHVPHGGDHFGKYQGIWQKVRSMLTYIHQHYGDEYDYFHFNGDDTFLIVENLKAMLQEQRPPYVGMWRSPHWPHQLQESDPNFYYPLGGAGYTLSRETLRVLVQEVLPGCETDLDAPHEDYLVARCLWPVGIRAAPYWDENGASRYNPGGVSYYQENFLSNSFWSYSHATLARYYPSLPPFPTTVAQAISNTSVSFHLVQTPALMRRYERLIYRLKEPTMDDCNPVSLRQRQR